MEDLGFFPYPSSFSTGFADEILDPGPTSFFLKDPHGEDVLLAQGLDQLQNKLGLSLFEEENRSPVNVDDDDWLMRDLSDDIREPIDFPFTLDEIKAEGYALIDGILQDPNQIIEPLIESDSKPSFADDNNDGYKCLVCNIALFRLKEVIGHVLTVHCSKGDYMCTLCNTQLLTVGAVKKHIKNDHFGFTPFQCPACKKMIQQKNHLKAHIEKQHPGKKGLLKKALANHNKAKNAKNVNPDDELTCQLCYKHYNSIETKERHLATFHKQNEYIQKLSSQMNQENLVKAQKGPERRKSTEQSLDCPVCLVRLPNLELKKDHVQSIHHNLRTIECSECPQGTIFHSQMHLKAHQMALHMNNAFAGGNLHCKHCKIPMKNSSDFLHHVEETHAYQCPECPRHLQTTSGLAKHYKKAHINQDLLCCNFCGNCYKDEKELAHHVFEEHENNGNTTGTDSELEMMTAGSQGSTSPDMNKSLLVEKIMHPDVLKSIKKSVSKLAAKPGNRGGRIPCEYCRANEKFDSEHDVLEHIKSMHPMQCPDCPLKMFKYPTSVRKHFKKFHGDETPFFCKTCTLVFKSQAAVQNHMENEHGIANIVVVNNVVQNPMTSTPTPGKVQAMRLKGDSITCIVCGETEFESSAALADHRSENHFYKCMDCDKEYKLTDSLRKHVKVTHNENVTMTCCKFCDKVFMDTSQKPGHMASMHSDVAKTAPGHSNNDSTLNASSGLLDNAGDSFKIVKKDKLDKYYQCPRCPKSFSNQDTLTKHGRFFHNISVKFCSECNMTFVDIASRNIHMHKIHGGSNKNIESSLLKITPPNAPNMAGQVGGVSGPRNKMLKSDLASNQIQLEQNNISSITSINVGGGKINKNEQTGQGGGLVAKNDRPSGGGTNSDAVYKCPKCPKTYNIAKSLRKHCRKNHNKLSICFCHHCPKVFTTVSQRDAHVDKTHPNIKMSPASKESTTTAAPSSGLLNNTPASTGLLANSTVTKSTPIKTTISVNLPSISNTNVVSTLAPSITHAATLNNPNNSPRIIVVKSPNKTQGMTTILKKVEVIQPAKCPQCQEFISNLKHHICELPWKCPVIESGCRKTYKLSSGLRKHCREAHRLGQVAVCEICQITFMDGINGLEEHNKKEHSTKISPGHSPNIPSSPESFHGFVTPTKELEMSKRFETIILNLSDI